MASPGFTLSEQKTFNLRDLPPDAYLVHATNCLGSWGAGIALEIADIFPAACQKYVEFCDAYERGPDSDSVYAAPSLAGRCLIIPPQQEDAAAGAPRVSIVCLFTSYGYGRNTARKPGRDPKGRIVEQTARALADFRRQMEGADEQSGAAQIGGTERRDGRAVTVYSPMFNSGLFKVPWEETAQKIKETFKGWNGKWIVLTL